MNAASITKDSIPGMPRCAIDAEGQSALRSHRFQHLYRGCQLHYALVFIISRHLTGFGVALGKVVEMVGLKVVQAKTIQAPEVPGVPVK